MAISIKEPCHEDWTNMTPNEKGAFCKACALDVIDFTDKTPMEIKSILSLEMSANTRTCGRISNYQLDQINDDFFRWKSDSEAFRSVWIFSMIAVFGLTLFSCQNTHTKELVNQLNIDTTEMLAAVDSLDIQAESDSSQMKVLAPKGFDSLAILNPGIIFPYEIITQGGFGGDIIGILPFDFKLGDLKICVINGPTLGTISLGSVIIQTPEVKQKVQEFLEATTPPILNLEPSPTLPPVPTLPQPKNTRIIQPLEGVLSSGNKVFESFIHPNPINSTSRLYIDAKIYLELEISIHKKGNEKQLTFGQAKMEDGKHALDLKFTTYEKGEYQVVVKGLHQTSILDITV
jgi:hypothetical protein